MSAIKTVDRSGQISLGKEYAGRQVLVDEVEHQGRGVHPG